MKIKTVPFNHNYIPFTTNIEKRSFAIPWEKNDFLQFLQDPTCFGLVALDEFDRVMGHVMCGVEDKEVEILSIAVHPAFRKLGVAIELMSEVILVCLTNQIPTISAHISPSNKNAQNFFQKMGLKHTKLVKNHYNNTGDAIYFTFTFPAPNAETIKNRDYF